MWSDPGTLRARPERALQRKTGFELVQSDRGGRAEQLFSGRSLKQLAAGHELS
jgi:hypothetical protein